MLISFHPTISVVVTVSCVLSVTVSAQASYRCRGDQENVSIRSWMKLKCFHSAEEASLIDTITTNYQKYGLFFVVETITSLDGQAIGNCIAHSC